MHDDIETYRHHPACRNLIFFVYDPDALIPDRAALEKQIAVERIYDGVQLSCHLIVKPCPAGDMSNRSVQGHG